MGKEISSKEKDLLICSCHSTDHKYIFGYKCRYGAFDEFIFNSEDSEKLQDIANYLKKL